MDESQDDNEIISDLKDEENDTADDEGMDAEEWEEGGDLSEDDRQKAKDGTGF